eukprot:6672489-Pyramimonas_sp.AAC.1
MKAAPISNGELADQVRHCRLQTTHAQDKVKIWIEAKATGIEDTVVAALVQLGGVHKHGTPPRSHNARLLQIHLDAQ